ncbi:MAG: LysE family transporter [Duodenibacillus sp.]|nr:LysE family transporter [Duodenibacillus sp.]
MSWSSFLLYVFASTITPGPNNLMSMVYGIRQGFFRTLRFNAGILTGFAIVMLLCTLLSTALSTWLPVIRTPMLVIGAAYLCWLAWKVWNSTYDKEQDYKDNPGFVSGLLLQFVNAKIYVYGIMSMNIFVLPHYSDPAVLALFALLLAVCGSSCNLCWSAFGSSFHRVFKAHAKPVNAVLALTLLYCAASLFF